MRPKYPIDKVKPEKFFAKLDIDNAKARMTNWARTLARTGH